METFGEYVVMSTNFVHRKQGNDFWPECQHSPTIFCHWKFSFWMRGRKSLKFFQITYLVEIPTHYSILHHKGATCKMNCNFGWKWLEIQIGDIFKLLGAIMHLIIKHAYRFVKKPMFLWRVNYTHLLNAFFARA